MHIKTVVLLSPFFYPEDISTGKYNTKLAEALVSSGCKLDVVCSHPVYPTWRVKESNDQLDGVNITRGGKHVRYHKNPLIRRFTLESWYAVFSSLFFWKQKRAFDCCIQIIPPSFSAFLFNMIWASRAEQKVMIVHDLQGIYAEGQGALGKLIGKVIFGVESYAFRRANKLIFLSETMMRVCINHYALDQNKCEVAYPFANLLQQNSGTNLANIFDGDCIDVVYSGALGEKQNPVELCQLLAELIKTDQRCRVSVFSRGPIFDQIKNDYSEPKFRFFDLVPEGDLAELLTRSDIQIIPQAPNTADGSLPSKLPNIIAARTKLFCITDKNSELGALVNSYSKGVCSETWDLKENLSLLVSCAEMGDHTDATDRDAYLLSRFSSDHLVKSILNF